MFDYEAMDGAGQLVKGALSGASRSAACAELESRALLPVRVSEGSARSSSTARQGMFGPSRADITTVTEDLAELLAANVNLDDALHIMFRSSSRPAVTALLLSLRGALSQGKSFADVLRETGAFSHSYVKMVEMAETAGTLPLTLGILAKEARRAAETRRRVLSALAYPSFLAAAAALVLVFVLVAVVPAFHQALSGLDSGGAELFVFELSAFLQTEWQRLVLALALTLLVILACARQPQAREALGGLLDRLPVIGPLRREQRTLVFCTTLAMLGKGGVDITVSLRLIRDILPGRPAKAAVETIAGALRNGEAFSSAVARSELLPAEAVQMLSVGEETGHLGDAAERAAAFYERRFFRALDRLTSALGPVILLGVSALIAWIIVSIMSALLSINEALL